MLDCFTKIFQLLLKHLLAVLLYLNIDFPTCLLYDYLIKYFHFSVKAFGDLCDDHNLTLICWKGTLSQRFLFINSKIKTQTSRLIFASKFKPFKMKSSDVFYKKFIRGHFWKLTEKHLCQRHRYPGTGIFLWILRNF